MKISNLLSKSLPLALFTLIVACITAPAATFTVTNAKDSGAGSLRDVITQANTNGEPDTINFDPTFFATTRTIVLASEIQIDPDGPNPGMLVTINGPGKALLTISGNNVTRLFYTNTNAAVVLSGMTLRDGNGAGAVSPGNGGAILTASGYLTLRDVVITNNTVSKQGGGLYLGSVRSVNISNCVITQNSAHDGGGGLLYSAAGGSPPCNISNTSISDNSTVNSGGGAEFANGVLTMTNCQINGNKAGLDGAAGGGAVGGGFSLFHVEGNVTDTVVSGNSAGQIVNGVVVAVGKGGGIYSDGGPITFRRVTVTGNAVFGENNGNSAGGGMHLRGNQNLVIDSVVSGNNGGAQGGGILCTTGSLSVVNTTIANNSVQNGDASGGGIRSDSDGLIIINCTITGNRAEFGGGLDQALNTSTIHVQNTIIAGNTATNKGPDQTGPIISDGYNLIGDATDSSGFGATGDQLNVDPRLDPAGLKDNGGLIATIALQANSPAIDKGKSADVATDARALPRPFNNPSIANAAGGDGSDIGAFEDQPPNTSPGSNVTVAAPDGDATITFHSITNLGFTNFAVIDPPSAAGLPPAGYEIVDAEPGYDISTTATYTAPITVTFTVADDTSDADFARIRILHLENGELVDRTILPPASPAPNFNSKTISAEVSSLSPFVVALAPVPPNQPLNIATRMEVLQGDQVLIGGFIITGNAPKKVLLRAIGPSLAGAGVSGALADPVLELHAQNGDLIQTNDNWMTTQKTAIEATGIPPTDKLESAIVATLNPGNYTAIVSGKNNGTGIGLVEIYDLDQTADSQLANISTRGFIDTGDNVMIGGFILGGGVGNTHIYVRALGPSLGKAGISGALANPTLELHDANGAVVSSNDDWMTTQKAEIEATGIPPTDKLESALVETLSPGNYTAIVAGQNNGTGIGLVEVYRLP